MLVLKMEDWMHLTGVKISIFFLSSLLSANNIAVHEINKIENITLSNGSSITQGGVVITDSKHKSLLDKNTSIENNNSILQGVVIIEDKNITGIHYDIVNIINGYFIEED